MKKFEVPNPLPAPVPGGGPRDGYQWKFNRRYYDTREKALQPLQYGLAASSFNANAPLTPGELQAAGDTLYDWVAPGGPGVYGPKHVDFDQQIDYGQQDPYAVSFMRSQVYGYQRVPIGTASTTQPPNVVNSADLQGPAEPGKYLLVTCDINEL
jgi:hypothetical protein